MEISELFQLTIDRQASDLHIISGYYPTLRIHGELFQIKTLPIVTPQIAQAMLFSIIDNEQKENLMANKEVDIGYEFNGHRFRTNIYFSKGTLSASFRLIPLKINTLEELNLPAQLRQCVHYK